MNGKGEMTDLVRGCILPLQEKHAELFKKEGGVFKKDLDVFKNPQGLFATDSASCLFVKCVRTHRATHTVASGHTYIRIELHVRTHEPARIYVPPRENCISHQSNSIKKSGSE